MKVGTDAVILGAMADINPDDSILDIGTGSAVIALMLAQRSVNNCIDALEIDMDSVLQARENVQNSPWGNRIRIIHEKLQNYCLIAENKYDLIVSNPPFFEKALRPENLKKRLSRHTDNLPHDELLCAVGQLLKTKGRFVVIIPWSGSEVFREKAWLEGFFPNKELEIYPLTDKKPRRMIFEFSREKSPMRKKEKLYLRNRDGRFTSEYRQLTRDFYLDF